MAHILIVEDDLAFGTMMQTWLKKKGFETSRATNVMDAARLLKDGGKVDLVLSDLRLPDRDGLFLLSWMQNHDIAAPFIVMTNYAEVQNALLAMLKPGQCDWLKAITPEHIDTTPADQRTTLAHRLDKELEDIELRLKQHFLS